MTSTLFHGLLPTRKNIKLLIEYGDRLRDGNDKVISNSILVIKGFLSDIKNTEGDLVRISEDFKKYEQDLRIYNSAMLKRIKMEEKIITYDMTDVLFTFMEQWAADNDMTVAELISAMHTVPDNLERMCCLIGPGGTTWYPCPKKAAEE